MRGKNRKRGRTGSNTSPSSARGTTTNEPHTSSRSFRDTVAGFRYADDELPSDNAHSAVKRRCNASSVASEPPKDRRVPQDAQASAADAAGEHRRFPRKTSSTYVAPSHYAHLPLLSDVLASDLLILFIGLNPGITTSRTGHAYAHPSNLFWKLLFASGITDRRCAPKEDVNMPALYQLGFTNIVSRPTKDQSQLNKSEMVENAPVLEAKAQKWQPEVCCLVGKGIWEAVYRSKHGHAQHKNDFNYGWQPDQENMGRDASYHGSRVFVAASTSGASASLRPHEKEAIWKPLGDWTKARRTGHLRKGEVQL